MASELEGETERDRIMDVVCQAVANSGESISDRLLIRIVRAVAQYNEGA
jgi:hypothetical protein